MSNNSFWQHLPEQLSQPTSVAILSSIGLHAVVLGALPIISWSDAQENTQRLVNLIELPPSAQSRIPQTAQPPLLPSLPGTTDSDLNPDGLPSPPSVTTTLDPSSNPFKFPNLPSLDSATGQVTLPPITLPNTPDLPPLPAPPPLDLSSFVLPVAPQPPSLEQESVPPRLGNPPQTLPTPTQPQNSPVAINPGNRPRQIPDLSEFSSPPQIPPEFQATYPPDAIPVPPPLTPSGNDTSPVTSPPSPPPVAAAPTSVESQPTSPAEQLRGIEASVENSPSSPDRSIPEIPGEFVTTEEELLPRETQSPSEVAVNTPPTLSPPSEPVFSQQRAALVAEIKERRHLLMEDSTNTTPIEANRNWLTWVEAVRDVNPQSKSLTATYPKDACLKKLEGTAVYGVLVNSDGAIADVELIQSSGYGVFNEQAQETINKHTFGEFSQPTPFQVTVSFSYDSETCPSLSVADSSSASDEQATTPSSPPIPKEQPSSVDAPSATASPQPEPETAPPQPAATPTPTSPASTVEIEVVPPAETASPVPGVAPTQPASTPKPEPPQSSDEIEVVPPAEVMMPADSPEFYRPGERGE
jgi:TonB family protein